MRSRVPFHFRHYHSGVKGEHAHGSNRPAQGSKLFRRVGSRKYTMLYAITDRRLYRDEEASRQQLLKQVAVWAANGVSIIQLREKDLSAREHVELARAMLKILRAQANFSGTRLLVNGRPDVALAAGADGVHLPSVPDGLTPSEVRSIYATAGRARPPYLSISCHTLLEIEAARQQAVDCILFAPVFEKIVRNDSQQPQMLPGTGLVLLKEACRIAAPIPVFALGGVTAENAAECLRAGAAGIAAIRLMLEAASYWQHLV